MVWMFWLFAVPFALAVPFVLVVPFVSFVASVSSNLPLVPFVASVPSISLKFVNFVLANHSGVIGIA